MDGVRKQIICEDGTTFNICMILENFFSGKVKDIAVKINQDKIICKLSFNRDGHIQ